MTDVPMLEELERMKQEYEPLLPVERQLIWGTFATGVVLLVLFLLISRALA